MSVNILDADIYSDRNQPSVFQTATPYAVGSLALAGGGLALAKCYGAGSVALSVAALALWLFGSVNFFVTVGIAMESKNGHEFKANIDNQLPGSRDFIRVFDYLVVALVGAGLVNYGLTIMRNQPIMGLASLISGAVLDIFVFHAYEEAEIHDKIRNWSANMDKKTGEFIRHCFNSFKEKLHV